MTRGARRGCFGSVLLVLGVLLMLRISWLAIWWVAEFDKEWSRAWPAEETWNRTWVLFTLGAIMAATGTGLLLWSKRVRRQSPQNM